MQYTFQELNDFEQIMFKNMVTFNCEELERIANGLMSTIVLSKVIEKSYDDSVC